MPPCPSRVTCAATLLSLVAAAAAQAPSPEWQSITAERLRAPAAGDWLGYRRTYDVQAFSPLREINRRTVERLRPVWAYTVRDNSRWVATPIVANGRMYIAEGSGRVLALDAVTGELLWTHVRTYPQDIASSEAYPRHRGVAVYGDVVYFPTADSFLVALDARTGAKLWEVQTGDYRTGEGHAHAPLIADGKVFLGTTGGDFAARGKFEAYDAANGTKLWTFYTAPREGDPGFETWTENEQWPPLGAAAWNTASYDAELKLVYFSTGQPTPWTTAARGPGDALYSNTLLAVEADTGKLRWHFQLVPGDEWDRSAYEGMLVDLRLDGRRILACVPHCVRQHDHRMERARAAELRSALDPCASRRRLRQGVRDLPAHSRRPQSASAELQPPDGLLLSRRQQLLHERASRCARVSAGAGAHWRHVYRVARARLRLRR